MVEENHKNRKLKGGKTDTEFYVQLGIIAVLVLVIVFSFGKISSGSGIATGFGSVSASDIIPKGVPAVYGNELGISYDDVSPNNPRLADATIDKLSEYEDLELNEEQMGRYIKIGGSISCEYCCGANAIIFSKAQEFDI